MSKDPLQKQRERCFSFWGEQCLLCGTEDNYVMHHVNGDTHDGRISNIIPVCESHHRQIHAGAIDFWCDKLPDSIDPANYELTHTGDDFQFSRKAVAKFFKTRVGSRGRVTLGERFENQVKAIAVINLKPKT